MTESRILVVDDDIGVCQILTNIIEDNDLGEIVDSINDGKLALEMIPKFRPDIVFIDLLLPGVDGIEIVNTIKKVYKSIDFIMISQVSDVGMKSEAYDSGIEFYINKPINVIEVISVTKKVISHQKNKRVIKQIKNTLVRENEEVKVYEDSITRKLGIILAELGIISDKGTKDIIELVNMLFEEKNEFKRQEIRISSLYRRLSLKYDKNEHKYSSEKAIEQRIRRTIFNSLVSIANLGIEDFGNIKFDKYSSLLFGFQEVKKVMDCIRNDTEIKCTINIKIFLNGILVACEMY